MITKLDIHNFQSHKHSVLEFHSGVNVIVGTSDSGKSAIIRALRWLVQGKPRGDAFRSWWGGDTSVEITTNSGSKVGRTRTNSDALYYVNDLIFRAAGNDTPEMVLAELNIDEINIQKQSDTPFLIDNTPGEVASHFNRMANLEKIGTSQAYVTSELNKVKQRKEAKENELLENRQQFRAFRYLEALENELQALEQLAESIDVNKSTADKLAGLVWKIEQCGKRIDNLEWVGHAAQCLESFSDITSRFKEGEAKALQLEGITLGVHRTTRRIAIIDKVLSSESLISEISLKSAEIEAQDTKAYKLLSLIKSYQKQQGNSEKTDVILSAEPNILKIAEIHKGYSEKYAVTTKLQTLISRITNTTNDIDTATEVIMRYEDTLQNEMPNECPLCASNIPHRHE